MKRRIAFGVFLVLTAAPALAQTQGSAAEEAVVKELEKWGEQYGAAWEARDAAKAAAFYADDAIFVDQGVETRGRAAIEKGFAQVMSEMKKESTIESIPATDLTPLKFIQPDIVIVQDRFIMRGVGTPPEDFKGHYMAVLAKQSGSWKILAVHQDPLPPPSQK
jgi:uncharacterized protein (TIGR02246 family)